MTVPTSLPLHDGTTVSIDALHLSVTETYPNGATHNVHVIDDPDLVVKLSTGGENIGQHSQSIVLVVLDVDGDHDDVMVYGRDQKETLNCAFETVYMAFTAIRKVRRANDAEPVAAATLAAKA